MKGKGRFDMIVDGRGKLMQVPRQDQLQEIPSVDHFIDLWLADLRLDKPENTVKTYAKAMRLFCEWLEGEGLTLATVQPQDVKVWRQFMFENKGYAIATVNLWLTAVRRFYAWLIEQGMQIFNPAVIRGIPNHVNNIHRRDLLTSAEIRSLMATCTDAINCKRDRAIMYLMAYPGLRTVEVQRADLADLQTKDDRLILWVQGKGHIEKDDFIVVAPIVEEVIHGWIAERGDKPGPLFMSLSNRSKGTRLSLRSIRGMVKGRMKDAGIVNGNKSTHSLRHSAITSAIRHGASPLQVQAMARHKSFDTTLGYYHEVSRTENPAEDLVNYDNGENGE